MIKEPNCYIINLSTKQGILEYKEVNNVLNIENPFYSYEIINDSTNSCHLRCFVLSIEDQPIIIMPFSLIPIEINSEIKSYYDVNSPYGFSGPLYSTNTSDELLRIFWEELQNWYLKNNVVTEFIRFGLNYNYRCYNGTLVPTLLNIKGNIESIDNVWSNFKSKVRNNFRKAEKENLKCEIFYNNITPEVISSFHEIYSTTMVRNKAEKRYFFSLKYFESLVTENKESCAIGIVYLDKTPISVEFLLLSGSTIFSHLGGTVAEYFHLRPNDFLKLKIISWGSKIEKKYFVLGGGRENGDALYEYKKSYFPKDTDVIYYTGRKIINQNIYDEIAKTQAENWQICDEKIDFTQINYFPIYRYHKENI